MNMTSMHGSVRGALLALAVTLAGCSEQQPAATTTATTTTPTPTPDPTPDLIWTTGDTADGTWSIAWRPVDGVIPPLDPFTVEVVVRDPAGGTVPSDLGVLVDASMPHHGHGMNVEPRVTRTGDVDGGAAFLAEGMLLHMPGRWEFTVDVLRDGEVERAQWTVMLDD
ncbi:MAG: hypothetical protein RLZZ461_842 [Planctomycetota bacterium]|jgi:hypothetical protein